MSQRSVPPPPMVEVVEQPIPLVLEKKDEKNRVDFVPDQDMDRALAIFFGSKDWKEKHIPRIAQEMIDLVDSGGLRTWIARLMGDPGKEAEEASRCLQKYVNELHLARTTAQNIENMPAEWLKHPKVFPSELSRVNAFVKVLMRWRRALTFTSVVLGAAGNTVLALIGILPILIVAFFIFPRIAAEIDKIKAMFYTMFKVSVHVDASNTVQPVLKQMTLILIAAAVLIAGGLVSAKIIQEEEKEGTDMSQLLILAPILATAADFHSNLSALMNFESHLMPWNRLCEDEDFLGRVRAGWPELLYMPEWRTRVYFESRRDRLDLMYHAIAEHVIDWLQENVSSLPEDEQARFRDLPSSRSRRVSWMISTMEQSTRFPASRDDILLFMKDELPQYLRRAHEMGMFEDIKSERIRNMSVDQIVALEFESTGEDDEEAPPKLSNLWGLLSRVKVSNVDAELMQVGSLFVSFSSLHLPLNLYVPRPKKEGSDKFNYYDPADVEPLSEWELPPFKDYVRDAGLRRRELGDDDEATGHGSDTVNPAAEADGGDVEYSPEEAGAAV